MLLTSLVALLTSSIALYALAIAFICIALPAVFAKRKKKKPLASVSPDCDFASFRMRDLPEIPEHVEVLIIGGGVGGLSAGSILAKQGYQVLVLEQHDRFGGATHVFDLKHKDKDGEYVTCQFDSGYHYTCYEFCDPTTRTGQFLKYLNGDFCKWNDLGDPYDRVMLPGVPKIGETEFHFVRDFDKLTQKLIGQITSHPDTKKYLEERFAIWFEMVKEATSSTPKKFAFEALGISKATVNKSAILQKLENYTRQSFEIYGPLSTAYVIKALFGLNYSKADIISQKLLPKGIQAQIDGKFKLNSELHCTDPSLYDTLQKLQALLVHPIGDYAVQPKESSFVTHAYVVQYYEHGSSYPSTSPQDMSLGMAREIFTHGGACVCGVTVNELIVTKSKVLGVRVGRKNKAIRADRIINASGIWNLYNRFLPKEHPERKRFLEASSKKDSFQPSMGHFYTFLCLKGSPEELGLDQTNRWCLNDLGCGEVDPCYDAFFEEPTSNAVPATYITFPCMKESHWSERWEGISNCIIFCDAPYAWFEEWKDSKHTTRPDDYVEFENMLEKKLLGVFFEKFPQLKDKIIWVESATPLSSEYYLGAFRGADYGSRMDINYFTGYEYLMTSTTNFCNLFQAGQDAFVPSISGAMHGGIMCALGMLTPLEKASFVKQICVGRLQDLQKRFPKESSYEIMMKLLRSL